ncbi:TauD/TfdA family dioxygenase [Streptomyces sp. NPDC058001]|uniref:TauD/TfdA family dioxygenase n=1 Tax=Streptomyces sp. NPDC058001 TaxID=3346300 RepID=UPI0036EDE71B
MTDGIRTPEFGRRRAVGTTLADLVHITPSARPAAPVVVTARHAGITLTAWLKANAEAVEIHLHQVGAVLCRGFAVGSAEDFAEVVAAADDELLDYVYGSTPRSRELDKVYTSTEYPADQTIAQHNELSYATSWPAKLWFCCLVPAAEGGQTPLADSRRVLERIPPEVRERFERHGVMYTREYGTGVDLTWQQTFETADRGTVERFCAENGIRTEWGPHDTLRTTQVCQAVAEHPLTGERVWFNQAHLFHPSILPPDVRASLASSRAGLSRDVCYGDGTPIDDAELEEVRRAYEAETHSFDWAVGDVLIVDNILVAHGRRPYRGSRRVLVAMSGTTRGN